MCVRVQTQTEGQVKFNFFLVKIMFRASQPAELQL